MFKKVAALLVAGLVFFSSCTEDATSKIKNDDLFSNLSAKPYRMGDVLEIVTPAENAVEEVWVNGTSIGNDTHWKTNFELAHLGSNTIRIRFNQDGKRMERDVYVSILPSEAPKMLKYEIVNSYKHPSDVFSQGFVLKGDYVYESAGQYGESRILKYPLNQPEKKIETKLDRSIFAEGLTGLNDLWYQVTWHGGSGFVWKESNNAFIPVDTFDYPFALEGWGLCSTDSTLIMSDGTNMLYEFSPKTFKLIRSFGVYDRVGPRIKLNELEYRNGIVYANIWGSEEIVLIDVKTGAITGQLILKGLTADNPQGDVLNGITFKGEHLLVTGKYWTHTYELKLAE